MRINRDSRPLASKVWRLLSNDYRYLSLLLTVLRGPDRVKAVYFEYVARAGLDRLTALFLNPDQSPRPSACGA
jgi:hypothetical protein